MTERAARSAPARRRARLAISATGLAAAGVAGALVAGQIGGGSAASTRAVLTSATLEHLAVASQAAMTSGRADIDWTSGKSSVVQHIEFDGPNWNDVMSLTGAGAVDKASTPGQHVLPWAGDTVSRVVDGQAYHYPAISFKPKPHNVAEWMHIVAPGGGQSLNIPDPRALLGVLSPSAGFVTDGYTTVNGVKLQHLRATTPSGVPLTPLDPIIQSEPDNARLSALDLWVDSSGVVLKAQVMVTGTGGTASSVTLTVTFSEVGQAQPITAPPSSITFGG